MKSISTPPLINSLQQVEDTELSSEDLNSLAKMLAEMIYQNLRMRRKQTEVAAKGEVKANNNDGTPQNTEE